MFERFTERARQVVVFAQDEARELRHDYIGTEHLLLGLLREEEGLAARVLATLGVTLEGTRADVARVVGEGEGTVKGQIPFTPRAKHALELSLNEATELGHGYIGTEHVLLGVAREGRGVAARILGEHGVPPQRVAIAVLETLQGGTGQVDPAVLKRYAQAAADPGTSVQTEVARSVLRGPLLPPFALGWVLGAVTLGAGILIGWAISH
jgi:ATP-dependent Clp protease ATP-binding subunit ClpC